MNLQKIPNQRSIMFLIVALLFLVSCAGYPSKPHDAAYSSGVEGIEKELQTASKQKPALTPPAAVTDALLPALPSQQLTGKSADGERFDITVDNVAARDFFMGLVKGTSYNMAVHPKVSGEITLNLKDVTIDEAMNVVREIYGFPFSKKGNLYQVMPAGLRTQVFKIDYLSLNRLGKSETTVNSGDMTNNDQVNNGTDSNNDNNDDDVGNTTSNSNEYGTRITTNTDANFWQELTASLQAIIGTNEGNRVVVTPQAGLIVVTAQPDELLMVHDYLEKAELIMRRQVVLEAKFLEVQLNDSFQSGINWTQIMTPGDNTIGIGVSGQPLNGLQNVGGVFGMTVDAGDFTALIQLLETQGNVQVLSSPRVSTVNNQKAVIKVGRDEYFVTDVSNTNSDNNDTNVGENTQDIQLTPFFSGIALDVTPQISETNEIVLHVHPSITQVKDQTKTIVYGDKTIELPVALSIVRETDTVVFARSNQVIILGGLMETQIAEENAGLPGMGNIPFVGGLFTQQRSLSLKTELVVLLKPIIMGADGLPEMAEDALKRVRTMRGAIDSEYLNATERAE